MTLLSPVTIDSLISNLDSKFAIKDYYLIS